MNKNLDKKILLPFLLTLFVIIADQITKALVVKYIPLEYGNGTFGIGPRFFGDAIRLIRINNTGVAFSMGDSMPLVLRRICFGIVPLIVIALVIGVYFRNKEFTTLQRWAIAGIIGGGIGNIIDRFFRPEGVIDFIDCVWFGISNSPISFLRWQRWPTFNVADSAVVVCGILLIISFLVSISAKSEKQENK